MSLTVDVATEMAYALGIGILIGLERSLNRTPTLDADPAAGGAAGVPPEPALPEKDVPTHEEVMGIRTYSVLSLSGFGAALLGAELPIAAGVLIAGMVALVILMYMHSAKTDPGITTEVAAIACCGLGTLCHSMPHTAGVIAVLVTVLLAMKRFTHTALRRLRRVELTDTLKFLVIILIVWPLLPNRALDPYGAFNPHKVVLLVILISGIGFVGYFLTRFLGASRGLGLTGLLGGLTSSTAVTAANVGAIAITIAVIANSVVKSGIALYSGGLKFGRQVGPILLGATVAGLVVLLVA